MKYFDKNYRDNLNCNSLHSAKYTTTWPMWSKHVAHILCCLRFILRNTQCLRLRSVKRCGSLLMMNGKSLKWRDRGLIEVFARSLPTGSSFYDTDRHCYRATFVTATPVCCISRNADIGWYLLLWELLSYASKCLSTLCVSKFWLPVLCCSKQVWQKQFHGPLLACPSTLQTHLYATKLKKGISCKSSITSRPFSFHNK